MAKNFRKAGQAIFGGALALEAVPLIKSSNRTIAAMVGTAESFIGIGVTSAVAKTGFGMVEAPVGGFTTKRKTKRRKKR